MRAVLYEDRATDVVGVKILVASIRRHSPSVEMDVTLPPATEDDRRWFESQPNVRFRTKATGLGGQSNVKPSLLKRALDEGADEAVWIDSDIVVVHDFRSLFEGVSPDAISVVEETFGVPYQGGTIRTTGLGLAVGRRMRMTTNSCVTRVTSRHRALLDEWEARLCSDAFLEAMAQHHTVRPRCYKGDQDVLTGLLGGEQFASVPIHWLRRGRDVAHCFQLGGVGYNLLERLGNIAAGRTPIFAHSCGDRPYRPPEGRPTVHLETSPYTIASAAYEEAVGEPLAWTRPTLASSRWLRKVFADDLNTSELLPTIGRELLDQRILKTLVRPIFKHEE